MKTTTLTAALIANGHDAAFAAKAVRWFATQAKYIKNTTAAAVAHINANEYLIRNS